MSRTVDSEISNFKSGSVPTGYKQTEVGIIPVDWDAVVLIDVAERISVGLATSVTQHYRNEGVPIVRNLNIKDGYFDGSDVLFVSREFASLNASKAANALDVLTVRTGSNLGLTCVLPYALDGCQTFTTLITTPKRKILDSDYLCLQMSSPVGKGEMERLQVGGGKGNLNTGHLKDYRLAVPPLPEQRAIAEALSDVDGLLGGLDRLIAKKRELKQAAMQQLLTGQTRLPGFHGEWEVKTLIELADRKKEFFDDGDWIESEHITTEGIRLIQTGNIGIGSFVEKEEKKYINEASFTALRCKQLKQDDLLVCRLADPAGRACVLGDIGEERIVTSVDVTIFRPPSALANRQFLSQVFSTSDWFRAVSDRSGGTTHKRISRGALGRLAIDLPPLAEQFAIAEVLTDMDAELAALEQRRNKTRDLKQAMMQELLTGKTRLV